MFKLRLILAWLVMAALPLQGFAAASMLFCGLDRGAVAQPASGGRASDEHHHTAVHAAGVEHSAHEHESHSHAKAYSGSGTTEPADQDAKGHACPICASCCHVVAVGGVDPLRQTDIPPSVEPVAPVFRVATRVATIPDKPPRA